MLGQCIECWHARRVCGATAIRYGTARLTPYTRLAASVRAVRLFYERDCDTLCVCVCVAFSCVRVFVIAAVLNLHTSRVCSENCTTFRISCFDCILFGLFFD